MLNVSQLNEQIKSLLESTFLSFSVKGEVSRVTYHSSGHLYFTLKDDKSAISCVMFKGNNQKLKFRLEESMSIVVHGAINVYTPQGKYQIIAQNLEPDGSGALAIAYEQLKKKLEAKGYFDKSRKKVLPKFPKKIAIVSSKTAAGLADIKEIAQKRWPLIKMVLCESLMQGENAKYSIVQALKTADNLQADIIVLARGGGSIEDLWCFNEEIVADAIYNLKTPIVSAIGHEIDFVISDFVADLRAPTPSASMEMILPDINEIKMFIDNEISNLNRLFVEKLEKNSNELKFIILSFKKFDFQARYKIKFEEINILKNKLKNIIEKKLELYGREKENLIFYLKNIIEKKLILFEKSLYSLKSVYEAKEPSKNVYGGYAQIVKNGKKVSIKSLQIDDLIELQTKEIKAKAKIIELIK